MMTAASEILGTNVYNNQGHRIDIKTHCAGKIVGLYFAAQWNPNCQEFGSLLIDFYEKYKIEKEFEIVFISGDEDAGEFKEYFQTMPWIAISFDDREKIVSYH